MSLTAAHRRAWLSEQDCDLDSFRALVERTADPADRRVVILRPTDEGRRIRGEIDAARTADAALLFARLPAADRTELARLLQTLAD